MILTINNIHHPPPPPPPRLNSWHTENNGEKEFLGSLNIWIFKPIHIFVNLNPDRPPPPPSGKMDGCRTCTLCSGLRSMGDHLLMRAIYLHIELFFITMYMYWYYNVMLLVVFSGLSCLRRSQIRSDCGSWRGIGFSSLTGCSITSSCQRATLSCFVIMPRCVLTEVLLSCSLLHVG